MSRMTSTAYEFGRRTNLCAATGRTLSPGEQYVAALFEKTPEEGEGLERRDFCAQAWEQSPRPPRLFAFWRATVADQQAPRHALIDDESLLSMFEQLAAAQSPRQVAFRFVLALILIRKRLLVPAGSRPAQPASGKPGAMLVREKLTGPGSQARQHEMPLIEVLDPSLDESTIAEVTQELESVLKVDA